MDAVSEETSTAKSWRKTLAGNALAVGVLLFIAWVAVMLDTAAGGTPAPQDSAQRMAQALERLQHGQIPLWSAEPPLGAPFLGVGKPAVFYPNTLLHLWFSPKAAWILSAVLQMWIAATGAWLLGGRCHWRMPMRILGAVAFMFCAVQVIGVNLPQTNAIVWLPWALWTVDRLIEEPNVWRILGAAPVFAAQFLAGHLPASVLVLVACGLLYVYHLYWASLKSLRILLAMVVAVMTGALLAGVQLFPAMDYWRNCVWGDLGWVKWETGVALGGTAGILAALAVMVRAYRKDRPFVVVGFGMALLLMIILILVARNRMDQVPNSLLMPRRLAQWPGRAAVLKSMPPAWIAQRMEVFDKPEQVVGQIKASRGFDPREVVLADRNFVPRGTELPAEWWKREGTKAADNVVRVEAQNPEAFVVRTRGTGGWLVVRTLYDPGWRAWVGNSENELPRTYWPIVPAFGAMQAIFVPAGEREIHFEYVPKGWTLGLFASAGGVLAMLMLVGWGVCPRQAEEKWPEMTLPPDRPSGLWWKIVPGTVKHDRMDLV